MDKLLEILQDLHPEVEASSADALVDGGILDSFDIVTIVAEVEDAYGVTIPAGELTPENFNSARALFLLIRRLQEG